MNGGVAPVAAAAAAAAAKAGGNNGGGGIGGSSVGRSCVVVPFVIAEDGVELGVPCSCCEVVTGGVSLEVMAILVALEGKEGIGCEMPSAPYSPNIPEPNEKELFAAIDAFDCAVLSPF